MRIYTLQGFRTSYTTRHSRISALKNRLIFILIVPLNRMVFAISIVFEHGFRFCRHWLMTHTRSTVPMMKLLLTDKGQLNKLMAYDFL